MGQSILLTSFDESNHWMGPLLSKDGAIAIHLDDQEVHYKVICEMLLWEKQLLNSGL